MKKLKILSVLILTTVLFAFQTNSVSSEESNTIFNVDMLSEETNVLVTYDSDFFTYENQKAMIRSFYSSYLGVDFEIITSCEFLGDNQEVWIFDTIISDPGRPNQTGVHVVIKPSIREALGYVEFLWGVRVDCE